MRQNLKGGVSQTMETSSRKLKMPADESLNIQ